CRSPSSFLRAECRRESYKAAAAATATTTGAAASAEASTAAEAPEAASTGTTRAARECESCGVQHVEEAVTAALQGAATTVAHVLQIREASEIAVTAAPARLLSAEALTGVPPEPRVADHDGAATTAHWPVRIPGHAERTAVEPAGHRHLGCRELSNEGLLESERNGVWEVSLEDLLRLLELLALVDVVEISLEGIPLRGGLRALPRLDGHVAS